MKINEADKLKLFHLFKDLREMSCDNFKDCKICILSKKYSQEPVKLCAVVEYYMDMFESEL